MEVVTKTYKEKYCPFHKAWVNQGIASCEKGKNPLTDCIDCEFMVEHEVIESYTSTCNNNVLTDIIKK